MFEKITKTLSGLAFIKYINSLIDYVNTSDIDATRIKGQLDISNIPPAGLDNVIKVDTVTDMLALTVDDVQNGDTVMIIGVTPPVQYQVVDDTKLGTMDAFQEYAAGTATKALADINGNNIHTTYGKLAGNNTWTGNNYWNGSAIFNANLNIRGSATTPGDTSVYLWLGLKPEGSEQAPCIARNKTGELTMYAADYRHCFLKSGIQTSFASVYNSDGTVEFSSLNNTPWGKYTKANGLELTVHKTPTVNNDVPNKKYVDDSIANGDVNSAKYLNITNFIPSNSDFNDYKTPGEYQVQSNTEANTIANLPTSYNDATPRGGVLSVLIGFNAPRTSLVQIYRTYGSSYVASRTYQRCLYHENSSWTAWREIACTDEVGLLNQANTFTALNTFRANIAVSSGTTAGSQGQIILGNKPQSATVQANIIASTTGALNYIATENTGHYFRIGNNVAAISITTNESETVIFSHNAFEFARITNVGVAKWLGNANTATKLETARTINGVPFDGTKDITIGIPELVIASEAEAKAGTNNTKFMTPLRVKQAIEAQVPIKEIVNSIYPVGQIVEYASNINPNDLYSWQTWEQIKDVFTLSAGDKYTIGDTGGAATVTLTIDQIPAHWHTATASNDGEHIHSGVAKRNVNWQAGSDWTSDSGNLVAGEGNTDNAGGHSHKIEIQNTGGDAAHNNMPPYLVTIKWKRTS